MTWADDVAKTLLDNGIQMRSADTSISWGWSEPPTMPIELWSIRQEPLRDLFNALLAVRGAK